MAFIKRIKQGFVSLLLIVCMFFTYSMLTHAVDTIKLNDVLTENETLISAGGVFELGFFTVMEDHFLGIWFKDDVNKKAVWVANVENPMDSFSILQISKDGNLLLMDRRQSPLIINSDVVVTSGNTSATLLDSGNFILRKGDETIWQSFDRPTDTYLPGMKLGIFSYQVPHIRVLISWVSPQNPAHGAYALVVYYKGSKKLTVRQGDGVRMDIGSWDGHNFKFVFEKHPSDKYNFSYVSNGNDTYFTFSTKFSYISTWFVVASSGQLEEYTRSKNGKTTMVSHALCEDYSDISNTSRCLTSMPTTCKEGDKFSEMHGVMPKSMFVGGSVRTGFSNCQIMCRSNCSCTAFFDDDQSGCRLYYGDQNDLIHMIQKGEGKIFIRGDHPKDHDSERKRRMRLIIICSVASLMVPIMLSLCYYIMRRSIKNQVGNNGEGISGSSEAALIQSSTNNITTKLGNNTSVHELGRENDQESPIFFSFSSIQTATDHFASSNKLGEGGYGPVYKGMLLQVQEIAVKRLSKRSGQGLDEFKNEVTLISKLQHRNLVRLLGCCVEGEENILIYEYMPNKSLDFFIFDSMKRVLLDWTSRVKIIEGVAQGLLYLHKYSRVKIIHRDLKTSNILLDGDMNPKISDFGMARIFGENEIRVKTNKIVGTYGYMSPEYAMDGLFSEKSDVFSFGVIVLEIISGKRNIGFFEFDQSLNLLGNAWNLWKEGRCMELMDSTLAETCSTNGVFRCVQLGLLCVQERATDRPTMSDVVSMLSTQKITLPSPREPAFLVQLSSTDVDSSSSKQRCNSSNEITVSGIYAR